MKQTIHRHVLVTLSSLLLLSLALILPISADMGPKPSITITVVNPPAEDYYLDLLVQHDPGDFFKSNLSEQELAELPEIVRTTLQAYQDGGFQPALTTGTAVPLFGNLIGERQADGTVLHHFSYHGTPSTYRIMVVTADGDVAVTDTLVRKAFRQTVTYDFATGEATNETSIPLAYATQFAMTCVCTLLLEGVLLWAFGFFCRENLLPFFVVNLLTQIGLTVVTGTTLIFSGSFDAYIVFFLCEAVIFLVEAIAFAFWLKGHTKLRRVIYAITANLLSAFIGALLIDALFAIIY